MSIDSGFEEAWKPPPALGSTFDLLRSPFGSPSSRLHSPRISALLTPASPLKPFVEQPSSLADDLDSPSDRISAAPPVTEEDRESLATENKSTPASTTSLAYMLSPEPIPVDNGVYDSEADVSGIMDDDESFSHTSVWEPATVETAIYIGAISQGPVAIATAREHEPQDTQSLDEEPTQPAPVENAVYAGENGRISVPMEVEQELQHHNTQPVYEEPAEDDLSDWDDDEIQTSVHDTMTSDDLNKELLRSAPSPLIDTEEVPEVRDELEVVETELDVDVELEDRAIDLDKTPSQPHEEWADAVTPHASQTCTVEAPTLPESQPSTEDSVPAESSCRNFALFAAEAQVRPSPKTPDSRGSTIPFGARTGFRISRAPGPRPSSLSSPPAQGYESQERSTPSEALQSSTPEPEFDSLEAQPSYLTENSPAALDSYLQSEPEEEDDTAKQDSDTLHSLYDIYTDVNEDGSPRPYSLRRPSECNLRRNHHNHFPSVQGHHLEPVPSCSPGDASASPARTTLRERVFTPPPSASQLRRSQTLSTFIFPRHLDGLCVQGRESPASARLQ
ncbi:hypothetical protein FA13DRAFT_1804110 [Coprinellus micaceus]|uniref:Uncharacterized protein n=1 Tax=Coprinellus micaceus TaxID=71717 RepID=A0A4Y7S9V9_COPMI|nr:hypothetical protein FA13DRAFT_1804110 [Coprinellus micaceus]